MGFQKGHQPKSQMQNILQVVRDREFVSTENYGTEVDTVRRQKFNFRWRGPPDASFSSLILVGWCEEGHPPPKTRSNPGISQG